MAREITVIPKESIDMPEVEGYDIKRCQDTLLRLLKVINEIFEKNEIRYFAAYGTLLGSIRHNGFIPWDDDLDIYIFTEDYERALDALRNGIPDDMIVHDKQSEPCYWTKWAKLRDLNSVTESALWPKNNTLKYRGLACDLFFVEEMSMRMYRFVTAHYDMSLKLSQISDKNYAPSGAWARFWDKVEVRWLTLKMKIARALRKKGGRKVLVANRGSLLCEKYEIADIFPLTTHPFEDTHVYVPCNWHRVLTQLYGDYMSIPSYEKRKHHFKMVTFINPTDSDKA